MSRKAPDVAAFGLTAAALLFLTIAAGIAQAQTPLGCDPPPSDVAADFSHPPNLDLIKRRLLYYRCTRYDSDLAAIIAEARDWTRLRSPQVDKPAIVLDIDETSLSNWTRIYKDDYAYFANGACDLARPSEACGDQQWQASEQAPAVTATLALYNFARCTGVAPPCRPVEVFFVTGRHESNVKVNDKTPTEWTLENLARAGYHTIPPDHLYMRPATSSGPVAIYKAGARADIERRFGVTIIANVGDQQSDLEGGHADRAFKLPNPFYFIP
jgi:predicted secreted acid phosphatase